MVETKRVDLTPLVTHHFALDDIGDAFELFSQQQAGVLKVALHPDRVATSKAAKLVGVGVDSEC
jgi:hypothetical protein